MNKRAMQVLDLQKEHPTQSYKVKHCRPQILGSRSYIVVSVDSLHNQHQPKYKTALQLALSSFAVQHQISELSNKMQALKS